MNAILRSRASWFLGAFLSICATAPCAEELLVMPFRCTVLAGRPVLTPSEDEGYRIVGQHEQRTFTACSPVNPDTCKQWTVHRFDLECGGARVPWTSVAVAVDGPRTPRAWIEDGQVRVRVGPWWNMAPGDPCARAGLYEDRWQARQFARYCAERRGAIPAVVDMPAGFAPMLGTGGIFVAGGAPRSAIPPPVTSALPPAPAVPSRPPPPRDPAKELAKRQVVPPEPTSKTPPPALAAAPQPPAPPGTAEHPTIINRPDPPQVTGPQAKEPPPKVEGAAKFGAPALKQAAEQLPPASAGEGTGTSQSIEVSLISMAGTPVAILAGLAMIAAFTAGTFAWLRKHERAYRAGAASREFASVSLTRAQHALAISPRVEPDAGPPSTPVQYGATSVRGPTGIPRNRAEALTVLGMGVTPDATQLAIKRIVDGLRLSWHPDHAKNEADRQIRELRLKQINAAWDILNAKRVEA